MKNLSSFCHHWIYLGIALPVLLLLTHCAKPPVPETKSQPATSTSGAPPLITLDSRMIQQAGIQVEKAQDAPLAEEIQVMGRIGVNENRTARVGAIADGRIATVQANVGDLVKEGQRLASLRSHEVDVARAEYAKARAELKRFQAEMEYSKNALARAEKLYQLKAASIEQVQRAQTDQQSALAAVASATADIGRIEEHLSHLGLSPESALEEYGEKPSKKPGEFEEDELIPVTAPISGTILKRLVSPGTVVTPSNDLFVLSDLSSLWLTAEVPEKHLAQLKPGLNASFTVQAYPLETFRARIVQIGDALDPDTRTVQVRCQISNVGQKLKPEMYATIRFELGQGQATIVIPASSLQEVNGKPTVFVQHDQTHFRPVTVRLGRQTGPRYEVLEGIKAGEVVVSKGSFLLKSEMLKQSLNEE
jgi:membrane fusion protein, heavy metal efflux system